MLRRAVSIAIVASACGAYAASAHAEGGYVTAGGAGILYNDDKNFARGFDLEKNAGVGAFGSVGYRWDSAFATEIEGGLKARSFDGAAQADNGRGGYEDTKVLMVNARIAPDVQGALKPYAGVGAGVALVNSQDHSLRSDRDDVAPAGQAMAGFSLDVSKRASLFAEYRYFKLMESSSASGGSSAKDESHSGFIGLRVRLGDLK